MIGASILLLLACSGFQIQGSPVSNVLLRGPVTSPSPCWEDNMKEEPIYTLENVRRKLYEKKDLSTALVVAAAGAALSTTKALVHQLCDSITVAVAEAVAKVLREHNARPARNERNYNVNSNTNIIGQGLNSVREPQRGQGSDVLAQDLDSPRESDQSPLDYGSDSGGISRDRGTGGSFYDLDGEEGVEKEESTTPNLLPDVEDHEHVYEEEAEEETSTSKPLPSQGWGHINLPGYQGNSNSNANSKRINFRRNSKRFSNKWLPDESYEDSEEEEGLKFMGNHKNSNINSNTNINSFRRNINSNSNNSLRRNTNSNANNNNNNRINRGYRYHRD